MRSLRLFFLGLVVASGWSTVSFATLGEKIDSVDAVAKKFGGARQAARQQPNFSIHEVTNPNLTLREYANKEGIIFAVAWDGLNHPDLSSILGSYFEDFSQGLANQSKNRSRASHSEVSGEKITVIKWGHMRSAHGKAFIKSLLPSGVTAEDIQ